MISYNKISQQEENKFAFQIIEILRRQRNPSQILHRNR